MTGKICPKCGKTLDVGNFCPDCNTRMMTAEVLEEEKIHPKPEPSKNDKRILAKIKTKQKEYDTITSSEGPVWLIVIGLLFCIILIGFIVVVVGVYWYYSNKHRAEQIDLEIEELETELDDPTLWQSA